MRNDGSLLLEDRPDDNAQEWSGQKGWELIWNPFMEPFFWLSL
jgi:hypothetical protein